MSDNILENVTVEQFKEYFMRDFPFLPLYQEGKTYFIDDIVYDNNNLRPSYALNYKTPVEYRNQLGFN